MIHITSKKELFKAYCLKKGFTKVCCGCIRQALKSVNKAVRDRAAFAYSNKWLRNGKKCKQIDHAKTKLPYLDDQMNTKIYKNRK